MSKKTHYKYVCGSHYTPVTNGCKGQVTFSAPKLEKDVIEDVSKFITSLNHRELIDNYIAKTAEGIKTAIAEAEVKQAAVVKAEAERDRLKAEIVKTLMGTSSFTETQIKELLVKKEAELNELYTALDAMQKAILRADMEKLSYLRLDDELTNWDERFEKQSFEGRKIMLLNVIDRIDVYSGYAEIIYDIKLKSFATNSNIDKVQEICYTTTSDENPTESPEPAESPLILPENFSVNRYTQAVL